MATPKKEKATYTIEGCTVSAVQFSPDHAQAVSSVADALKANAEALAILAKACRGPESVHLDTGIMIQGGN